MKANDYSGAVGKTVSITGPIIDETTRTSDSEIEVVKYWKEKRETWALLNHVQ